MRKIATFILAVVALTATETSAAWRMEIESKTVLTNQTGVTLNVTYAWDVPLLAATLPIVVRSITPGSFWTGSLPYDSVASGVHYTNGVTWNPSIPFATWSSIIWEMRVKMPWPQDCGGGDPNQYDGVSPDYFVINNLSAGDLLPAQPDGIPWLTLTFNVTAQAGDFEFDSACFVPSLSSPFLIDENGFDHGSGGTNEMMFTKGVITISDSPPPPPPGCTEPIPVHSPMTIRVPVDQPTIQAGINAAANGDTVLVADGVYYGQGNTDLEFCGRAILLMSEHGPDSTIIDCEYHAGRGFHIHHGENSTTTIKGFTVSHGYPLFTAGLCGGIVCDSASPTVIDCIFSDNYGTIHGAGMTCYRSSPRLIGCSFIRNYAEQRGGGILCLKSSPVLINCILVENVVHHISWYGAGGGLAAFDSSSVSLWRCTVAGNKGQPGAGIECDGSSSLRMRDCIVAFNAPGEGVGCSSADSVRVDCSDIFGNAGGDWVGCISSLPGGYYDFSADPLFCDTATAKYGLSGRSPCAPSNNMCHTLIGALGIMCDSCDCSHQGDCNDNGVINPTDIIFLINYALRAGPPPASDPACPAINRGDWDCNGKINLADITKMVSYVYRYPSPGPCNPCAQ